jgi:ribosomal protein L25 (general stress protein Ctc)
MFFERRIIMIKVNCEVETYPDSLELKKDMPKINIKSHWNRSDMIWIEIDGNKHLVMANDIIRAINNCTNK